MTLIFSLVGGLAIALIVQLLFASLGVALGLTILDLSPKSPKSLQKDSDETPQSDQSNSSLPITHLIGFGIALGVSSIIFVTAFISTDFSTIIQPRRGAIFGVIFWAIYWTLLIWLSTTTIAGIVDSLFGGAIASIKQLFATFQKSPDTPAPGDDDSVLQGLAAELSQIIDSQQALPALLASQREALVEEISDRIQLSPDQTESILTDITSAEPETSPTTYSTTDATMGSSSSLISQVESALDLPSWQQISQRVIDQIEFSDIEALVYQVPSLLSGEENKEQDKSSNEEDAAVTEEIQRKLVSYCRYTNLDLLTPNNLIDKIADQEEEHSVSVAQLDIDVAAIEDILSRRQTLEEDKKQSLIAVLEAVWHEEAAPEETSVEETSVEETSDPKTQESYPKKIQQALESSVQSIEWQEILAPSISGTENLVDQIKTQIARYLQKQDKRAFHPVQMAKDLTHIVGHGLRSLPHPSDLPNLAELETLWDKSSWQQALEARKDLTMDEVQEILAWGEAAWKPVIEQSSSWLQSLQSQADQLLSLVDSTSLDTAREAIVEQVGLAKEKLDEQATAMKRELQTQADAARRQGAIAAWWFFIALLGSGISSGGAGWLAIIY